MRSSNPVLTRLTPETHTAQQRYGPPSQASPYQTYPGQGTVVTPTADRMTVDDVIVKTVSLLAIVGVTGLAVATFVKDPGKLIMFWMGGMVVGLVLGLIIAFRRIVSPPLIITYAVAEGAFLGAVSKAYNAAFDGIVLQAVIGTFGIFFVMAALYKARVIRATPKFVRGMIGALIAAAVVIVLRFALQAFGVDTFLSNSGPIAILISLAIIVVGALSFILDFDLVEQSVNQGAPKQFAWYCAFGILLGLIWVYLEILRLLSYLRGSD